MAQAMKAATNLIYNININEGLKVADLNDLVDETISIDKFASKIDTDAIVVAFKSHSTITLPMDDLSEFIETGKNEVLDTEVSAGPDKDGKYLLFVEFLRNENFPKNLIEVLDSMRSLTLIKNWSYTFYGDSDEIKDVTMENLTNDIRLEKLDRDVTPDEIKETVEFFKNSDLDDINFDGDNQICFEQTGQTIVKQQIALGDPTMVLDALNMRVSPIQLDNDSLRECRYLRGFLGSNWEVTKINEHFVLANDADERVMIIK